jgi:hypothetical protein
MAAASNGPGSTNSGTKRTYVFVCASQRTNQCGMARKLKAITARHAMAPFRPLRVNATGNPICGFARATGVSHQKNVLAIMSGIHWAASMPAQYG